MPVEADTAPRAGASPTLAGMDAGSEGVSVRVCEKCGAKEAPGSRFCASCGEYLGWDGGAATLGGAPLAGTVPPPSAQDVTRSLPLPPDAPPPIFVAPPPVEVPASNLAVRPPDVSGGDHDVMLAPGGTAVSELTLHNPSSVVDGYTISAEDPPPWLIVAPDEAHLMPGQTREVHITFGTRPVEMVVAQRFSLTLTVCSTADRTRSTEVAVAITVPPIGPRASIDANPSLVRLDDATKGSFVLRLDNRMANYAQTFALKGSDPEAAVRFLFSPQVVEVPPGQLVECEVGFILPPLAEGREISRQLSISAVNDEGALTANVTVMQRSSPPREYQPVRIQLSPSRLSVINTDVADFDVTIDNRAADGPAALELSGRDPERRVSFAFTPAHVTVPPAQAVTVRARARAVAPPPGESVTHSFVVVASDGRQDVEAAGDIELTSTPSPIATAGLSVEPPVLNIGAKRRGQFSVHVDNRRGVSGLHVRLSGYAEDGTAQLAFHPAEMTVMPQSVGSAQLIVNSPSPPVSQTHSKRLHVTATDGERTLEAAATLTQSKSDRGPLAKRILVILGAVFMGLGAITPWHPTDTLAGYAQAWEFSVSGARSDFMLLLLLAALMRLLVAAAAVGMLFGLTGKSGGLIRRSAVGAVIVTIAYLGIGLVGGGGASEFVLGIGLPLIWVGAVLGYIGGVLARRGA